MQHVLLHYTNEVNMKFTVLLAPEFDGRQDAVWQATALDLDRQSVQRHVDFSSFDIQHYAFLTGPDDDPVGGFANVGTPCIRDLGSKISFYRKT